MRGSKRRRERRARGLLRRRDGARRRGGDLRTETGAGGAREGGVSTLGSDTRAGDGSETRGMDAMVAGGTLGRTAGVSTPERGGAAGLVGGGWIARQRMSAPLA